MPDDYISQFSGEEIDSAVRAAQIISGASTPAELRKKLEIRGDTIPVSAEDSTLISGALKYRTNPNLLDNWYFGNPVNQKSGYYIPAGVKYNTLSWTEAGTTDKAYPVIGYIGQDPLINVNGTNYIVGKSVQVPGYCAAGYTVDRWRTGYDGTFTVNVSDAGVSLVSGNDGSWKNLYEIIETSKLIVGQTYTFSFLAEDNGGVRQVYILDYGSVFDGDKGLYTITFVAKETTRNQDFGIQTNVGKTSIPIAAKLELGDTQTLAHKENGVWVLNEIPDFGEQLRRCQRYYRRWTGADNKPLGVAVRRESKLLELVFSLDTTMRVAPSLTFNGSFVCVPTFTWCSVTSIDIATPDTVAIFLKPNDDVTFDLDAYQINIANANEYIALSADL